MHSNNKDAIRDLHPAHGRVTIGPASTRTPALGSLRDRAERAGKLIKDCYQDVEPVPLIRRVDLFGGQWDIAKTRARLLETADPQRSALAGSAAAEGTPFARIKVAQLALKVEAQRLALDESKGRLLDVATANATIDEIASSMRDALLRGSGRGRSRW